MQNSQMPWHIFPPPPPPPPPPANERWRYFVMTPLIGWSKPRIASWVSTEPCWFWNRTNKRTCQNVNFGKSASLRVHFPSVVLHYWICIRCVCDNQLSWVKMTWVHFGGIFLFLNKKEVHPLDAWPTLPPRPLTSPMMVTIGWLWWGGWMYQIVTTGLTLDLGMLSTHLVFSTSSRKIRGKWVNSLGPGRPRFHFKTAIFNLVLLIGIFTSSNDNALRWMPRDLTDDKSTLVQVMAWCRQATSHYLRQCWPSSMLPYGITRPQWVNGISVTG